MWPSFALALISGFVFLFLPGYLAFRALRIARTLSVALAPIFAVSVYEVVCIVYGNAGVFATWFSVFAPVLVASAILFGVSCALSRGDAKDIHAGHIVSGITVCGRNLSFEGLCLALYVMIGVAFGCFLFLGNLASGPDGFSEAYDNIHHLGQIDGYLLSGDWSALHTTLYCGTDASFSPSPGVAFYPSGWHCLAAMVASFASVPSTIAANATNFLFSFIAYPASMYAFMSTVFKDRPEAVAFGSIVCVLIAGFPMNFMLFGPLYPNLAAYAIVPAYAASFICFATAEGKPDFRFLIVFVLGSLSMLFLQPNGVFTAAVLLFPYCAYQAFLLGSKEGRASHVSHVARRNRGFLFAVVAIIVMSAVWYALYRAPFLQSVVQHTWPANRGVLDAVMSVALYRFSSIGVQPGITIAVLIGFIATLRNREYFWVSAALLMACAIFVVDVRIDGELQHILGGFWYTDSHRIGAFIAMFSVPLAALGLDSVFVWLSSRLRGGRAGKMASAVGISFCFAVLAFAPWAPIGASQDWGINAMQQRMSWMRWAYDDNQHVVYDPQERSFVQKVEQIIPEGEVILNEPNDGSAFAWAVDGLTVYNRYARVSDSDTPDSIAIRQGLYRLSSDEEVKRAVDNVGAKYILVLDQGNYNPDARLWSYEEGRDWLGFKGIRDVTPGLEIVLSEGDMRLYRIVD